MAQAPYFQRSCGDCALCCHLGEIPRFKPFNQWCAHCSSHAGCDIYETRPRPCRDFHCHYLLSDLGQEWFPKECGFIVSTYAAPPRVMISVDPATPDNWRATPYIEQLRHWSQAGAVQVQVGSRTYAVHGERIDDLGEDTPDSVLVILEERTVHGMRYRTQRRPR